MDKTMKKLTKKNVYLVGVDDAEELDVIHAQNPEQAALEWIADFGEEARCFVWSAIECLPHIDVETSIAMYSEANPELSPVNRCWTDYIGKKDMEFLQATVDEVVKATCPVYYMADQLLLKYDALEDE